MRLDGREGDAEHVIGADAHTRRGDDEPRATQRQLGAGVAEGGKDEPDQEHHQAAEHVQLGVQVDDHVAGLTAAVEQLVDGRERLYWALQRPERERAAAGERERPQDPAGAPDRPRDDREQQPEGREHRDSGTHDQERVQRGRLFRLLRRQAAVDDEPALVEAQVKGHRVERERADEERIEAAVREPPRGLDAARRPDKGEQRSRDEHRQAGDEVDVGVADRIDPFPRMAGLVEPVRVGGLHLNDALDRSDGQRCCAGCEELPEMPLRLRHLDEPRLEDRQRDVRREAPVTKPHHAGPNAGRHLVPLAHVLLRELVVATVLDEPPDRNPVADQRDVEDEQAEHREPERALGEPLARERPTDDPRQHEPAESGREQRAAADDHHVRVRKVPDEVAGVAGLRQVLRDPGQILDDHVQRAEHEEETARDEVLRRLAVVDPELVLGVRLVAGRRSLAGHELEHRGEHDREEGDVGQELERREMLDVQAASRLAKAGFQEEDDQRPA